MPFKSEAQRKYLWANEPEIARDWTDTYGSRIQKDDGGIARLGLKKGSSRGGFEETQAAGKSYEAAVSRGEGAQHQQQALQEFKSYPTTTTKVNLGDRINQWANKNIPGRQRTNIKRRGSYIDKNPAVFDALLAQGLIEETGGVGAWDWTGEGGIES